MSQIDELFSRSAAEVRRAVDSMPQGEVAAVARQRFRPIVITSITTFVGLVPTAYGILGENSYLTPIFMSMAWGVAFGGLVTLILLPVLYMVDQDIRGRFARNQ